MKKESKSAKMHKYYERWYFLIPGIIGLLMYLLLPLAPDLTEYLFSRGFFRVVSIPLAFIVSLIPISLTELAAVVLIPAAIASLVLFLRRLVKEKDKRKKVALHGLKSLAWFISVLFFGYMFMHGANFYRLPAKSLMKLEEAPKDPLFLQQVCIDLAAKASAERENLAVDENGNFVLEDGVTKSLGRAGAGYSALSKDYPFLWGTAKRGKYVFLSYPWSYTGISGMYFPWFAEANVNIAQPHSAIPATAAHEIAHTRGFAREDECNFFAYLSCSVHPDPEYRYSGYLLAFMCCQDELYNIDKELWREAYAYCSPGVIADISQRYEFWQQFEGPVEELATKANDSFICAQGVPEGVKSYNAVTELVLAWYAQNDIVQQPAEASSSLEPTERPTAAPTQKPTPAAKP